MKPLKFQKTSGLQKLHCKEELQRFISLTASYENDPPFKKPVVLLWLKGLLKTDTRCFCIFGVFLGGCMYVLIHLTLSYIKARRAFLNTKMQFWVYSSEIKLNELLKLLVRLAYSYLHHSNIQEIPRIVL